MDGITFNVADHSSNSYTRNSYGTISCPADILKSTWGSTTSSEKYDPSSKTFTTTSTTCKDLIQSSVDFDATDFKNFSTQTNGFVDTVLRAYNRHHNLIIRPDDIWITILSQFNLFVNANAEVLRDKFVQHEGKKELVVEINGGTRHTLDYRYVTELMSGKIKENILDPGLLRFIIPNFTTTTDKDTTIACIMLMSTLKAYFSYTCRICCGIPSITLLGTKDDYANIHARLDKFDEFGPEPRAFATLLRPILSQFIAAFDAIAAGLQPDLDFWGRICHYQNNGSGPTYISGWLSAFCAWDRTGKWQASMNPEGIYAEPDPAGAGEVTATGVTEPRRRTLMSRVSPLIHAGLVYPVIDTKKIPPAFCDVEMKVIEQDGTEVECMLVAGHVGFIVSSSKEKEDDTLQPSPQWFMFEKGIEERHISFSTEW